MQEFRLPAVVVRRRVSPGVDTADEVGSDAGSAAAVVLEATRKACATVVHLILLLTSSVLEGIVGPRVPNSVTVLTRRSTSSRPGTAWH
jgi:hypothetical protein